LLSELLQIDGFFLFCQISWASSSSSSIFWKVRFKDSLQVNKKKQHQDLCKRDSSIEFVQIDIICIFF
jgi:hypothetical protein